MRAKTQAVDHKRMRDINQQNLLNLIRLHGPISRPELATLSGLSLPTISGMINALLERRLVFEQGVVESRSVGRKAGLLEIHPDGGYAVGLKLTEEETTAVVVNLLGEVLYTEQWSIHLHNNSDHAVSLLAEHINQFLLRSNLPRENMIGVGCGISGYIDAERGHCVDSFFLGWRDVALGPALSSRLQLPVYLDNDVRCLAIYEKLFGQGQRYNDFLCISLGTGLGLGIIANGDLYYGAGGAGEFGHVAMMDGGRLCACGRQGCLESYVSDYGIVATYAEQASLQHASADPLPASIEDVLERARQGDVVAIKTFEQTGKLLGLGLAGLVNLFHPECIIFSGPGVAAGALLFESAEQVLHRHTFSRLGEHLQLHIDVSGYENWARGAGSLVLRRFFLSPIKALNGQIALTF